MKSLSAALLAVLMLTTLPAAANEALIRKAVAERLPGFPKIDEVRATPIPGLFEIRFGNDIKYIDAKGEFILEGDLVELRTRKSLTAERIARLQALDWNLLPLADAIVVKRGNGSRKLAVFEDPNCGPCKAFERGLQEVKDVTVYTFLIPILGADSRDKARAIVCSKDAGGAWQDWMVRAKLPTKPDGACDDAVLTRNLAFARKHGIGGTPAIFFEDGRRVPGAIPPAQIEERFKEAAESKG